MAIVGFIGLCGLFYFAVVGFIRVVFVTDRRWLP
jgi:hypothetical protein